jgi:BRCA1 C Terminus (BRCT) domain.
MNPHKRPAMQNTSQVFENCYIHILPVALGKKRLSLFQTQITNQGGICVSKLAAMNSSLTHIVLEDSIVKDSERCVRLLNSMNVDTNTAVKIVGTQWISKCLKECICVDTKEFELSLEKKTDKVNMQSNRQPIYEDGCVNEGQDPGPMKNDIGDFATLTVEHSPPKKLRPAASEVHLLIYQYVGHIIRW